MWERSCQLKVALAFLVKSEFQQPCCWLAGAWRKSWPGAEDADQWQSACLVGQSPAPSIVFVTEILVSLCFTSSNSYLLEKSESNLCIPPHEMWAIQMCDLFPETEREKRMDWVFDLFFPSSDIENNLKCKRSFLFLFLVQGIELMFLLCHWAKSSALFLYDHLLKITIVRTWQNQPTLIICINSKFILIVMGLDSDEIHLFQVSGNWKYFQSSRPGYDWWVCIWNPLQAEGGALPPSVLRDFARGTVNL